MPLAALYGGHMKKENHPLIAYLKAEKLSVVWLAKQLGIYRVTLSNSIANGVSLERRQAIETATRGGFPVSAWPDHGEDKA